MGYEGTDEEFQWLPATNLAHTKEVIDEFHQRYPEKPGPDHFAPDHAARLAQHKKRLKGRNQA